MSMYSLWTPPKAFESVDFAHFDAGKMRYRDAAPSS